MFGAIDHGWNARGLLAIAGACLMIGNVRATENERRDEIVVGANHRHSADILSVTVSGRVPENGQKISVTARFSETEYRLERLSIVTPDGKTIAVPRSYFEKVEMPWENSLSLVYILDDDSKTVGGIWVFLEFGEPRRRADLKCTHDTGDPVFQSLELLYDTHARTFRSAFRDYCGEFIPEK